MVAMTSRSGYYGRLPQIHSGVNTAGPKRRCEAPLPTGGPLSVGEDQTMTATSFNAAFTVALSNLLASRICLTTCPTWWWICKALPGGIE